MKIIKTGETLSPAQFCNDWISADGVDGRGHILDPTKVQIDESERDFFLTGLHSGIFWSLYSLTDDGRFIRTPKGSS